MMCSVTTIAAVCNKEQNYAYCFLHFEKENPPQAAMTRIRITTRTMTTIITTLRAFCHHILFLRARASELKMKACWSRSRVLSASASIFSPLPRTLSAHDAIPAHPTDIVHHHLLHLLDLAADVGDRVGRGVVVEELLGDHAFDIKEPCASP